MAAAMKINVETRLADSWAACSEPHYAFAAG
jgi:hypothetical protein